MMLAPSAKAIRQLGGLVLLTLRYLILACCPLLLWRFWKFTVLPILEPDEPKRLPYWIPCEYLFRALYS